MSEYPRKTDPKKYKVYSSGKKTLLWWYKCIECNNEFKRIKRKSLFCSMKCSRNHYVKKARKNEGRRPMDEYPRICSGDNHEDWCYPLNSRRQRLWWIKCKTCGKIVRKNREQLHCSTNCDINNSGRFQKECISLIKGKKLSKEICKTMSQAQLKYQKEQRKIIVNYSLNLSHEKFLNLLIPFNKESLACGLLHIWFSLPRESVFSIIIPLGHIYNMKNENLEDFIYFFSRIVSHEFIHLIVFLEEGREITYQVDNILM